MLTGGQEEAHGRDRPWYHISGVLQRDQAPLLCCIPRWAHFSFPVTLLKPEGNTRFQGGAPTKSDLLYTRSPFLFQNAGGEQLPFPLCSARGPSGTERSLPWGKDSPATTPALDLPWLWEEGAGPWPPAAFWKELTALLSWSRNSALWVWLGIKCFSHPEGLFEFIKTPQFCSGANVRLLQVFFQSWTGHHSWSILQSPKLSSSFCLRPACKFWTLFSHPQSREPNCSVSHLVTEHRRART